MIRKSILVALWFIFLTFPLLVIKVNTTQNVIEWRWMNMVAVGIGSFAINMVRMHLAARKEKAIPGTKKSEKFVELWNKATTTPSILNPTLGVIAVLTLAFPLLVSAYGLQTMISALIFIMLGLGLNVVVGLAGLLDLGYVAFYAVGAYAYALLNYHFGISFWVALPIGALLGSAFGILLGIPVLRLRGDYLAIVTLGFGEIIRLLLENWDKLTFGPSGIGNIPGPSLLGRELSLTDSRVLIYYIVIAMVLFTMFVVNRVQNSRLGRSWVALREDETACQAMGIDRMKVKLTAFAVGATWAGMAGVIFAANTTFINPKSFEFWESVLILAIVVLGGQGSILGVILAAFVLKLLPEYVRWLGEYRMLFFGLAMVYIMVFRPQGFIPSVRRKYEFSGIEELEEA
jgi:branched-chain amino acid transport system permease protein